MRLWCIHPGYLDRAGLIALWREALLAQKVLQGRTKGYRYHPQLLPFKTQKDPVSAIAAYLEQVYKEGKRRGYKFKRSKICRRCRSRSKIGIPAKQLGQEFSHLLKKLKKRSPENFRLLDGTKKISPNPLFRILPS